MANRTEAGQGGYYMVVALEGGAVSTGRHSYVPFYASDWIAGTSRMTPLQELVYFRVCCFIWDKAEPCPATELPLMLGAVDGWPDILEQLIAAGKLDRSPDGSVVNSRALVVAETALDLWGKKSAGGKRGAAKTNKIESPDDTGDDSPDNTPDATPGKSDGGTGPGVPSQNQIQNHIPPMVPQGGTTKTTFKQATDGRDDLQAECVDMARRLFAEHEWPELAWSLLWDEFESYWGGEAARKKKVDWPRAFYNRAVERRTWKAFAAENEPYDEPQFRDPEADAQAERRAHLRAFIKHDGKVWGDWGGKPESAEAARAELAGLDSLAANGAGGMPDIPT